MADAIDEKLAIFLATGHSINTAAELAGTSHRTAHRRLKDASFLQRLDRAKADVRARLLDRVVGVGPTGIGAPMMAGAPAA